MQVVFVKGYEEASSEGSRLIAAVINHGAQTITRIEVRFSPDGRNVIPPRGQDRLPARSNLPPDVRVFPQFVESAETPAYGDKLTPWDTGIVAVSEVIGTQSLAAPSVMVRWTDRWGTRWEYKSGDVRQVGESAQWEA